VVGQRDNATEFYPRARGLRARAPQMVAAALRADTKMQALESLWPQVRRCRHHIRELRMHIRLLSHYIELRVQLRGCPEGEHACRSCVGSCSSRSMSSRTWRAGWPAAWTSTTDMLLWHLKWWWCWAI
jgi:hypothetical protein